MSETSDIWGALVSGSIGIVGTLIGGTLTYFTQIRSETQKRNNERFNVRHSIAAEIESIVTSSQIGFELAAITDLLDISPPPPPSPDGSTHHHDRWLQDEKEKLKRRFKFFDLIVFFASDRDPRFGTAIYSNLPNLGMLNQDAADVQKFYAAIAMLRFHVGLLRRMETYLEDVGKDGVLSSHSMIVTECRDTITETGKSLVARLRAD